jgi:hypothetical protein
MSYEVFFPLRPTNVMHQLGAESSLPLCNGRLMLHGLLKLPCVLWMPRIPHLAALPALFRAAAHLKAPLGVSLVAESTDSVELKRVHSPGGFFRAVVDAATEVDQAPPFVVHVDVPRVDRPDGSGYEAACNYLNRCLEAGFTSFGVDLTSCEPHDRAAVAAGLLAPVLDLELCVTVRLKTGKASDLAATLQSLKREGVQPDVVVLPGPDEVGEAAWQLAAQVAPLVVPTALGWRDPGRSVDLDAEKLRSGFIRCLSGGNRLPAPAGDADAGKIEALSYMEALDVLPALCGSESALMLADAVARPMDGS